MDNHNVPPMWGRGHPIELRRLSFSDVMDTAYNLYRLHWRSLLGLVALLVVPLQFVSEYLTRNYRHAVLLGPQSSQSQSGRLALISLVVTAIGLFFVQPLLTAGVVRAVAGFHLGEDPSPGAVLDYALPLLGRVLLVVLLYSLAVAGGILLLIIPGLVFFIRFLFGPAAAVIEGKRGREALRRSWSLTRGHGWRLAGIVIVAAILAGLVASFVTVPTALVAQHMDTGGWVVRAIGASIGQVISTPFSLMVQVLLYFDLRVRKEGLDLERLRSELSAR